MLQGDAHLGKGKLRLVAKTEERFCATHLLSRPCDLQHFLRRHGVCPGLAGIAAKRAVSAVITAEIREWKESLT
jgi:methyl coenzyme M reductase subunit C-like uncharacterized protein (methanogenesis marker protein 7)